MMTTRLFLASLLVFGCLSPALAQGDGPELAPPTAGAERGAEHVWITRLYEAFAKKDFQEVTAAFQHRAFQVVVVMWPPPLCVGGALS